MQRDNWRERDWRDRDRGENVDDRSRGRAVDRWQQDGPRRADEVELWGHRMSHQDWEAGTYGDPNYFSDRGQGGYRSGPPDWDRGGYSRPAGPDRDWERRGPGYGQPGRGPWGRDLHMEPSDPREDDLHRGDAGNWRDWPTDNGSGFARPGFSQRRPVGPAGGYGPPERAEDRGVSNGPSWWNDWRRGDWGQGNQPSRHFHGRTNARGYQRSDERIREDIYDRLMDHPDVDSQEIEVIVASGEVTLRGTVDDRWEKRLAEDVAESISGVTYVRNELRYHQFSTPDDTSSGHSHNSGASFGTGAAARTSPGNGTVSQKS